MKNQHLISRIRVQLLLAGALALGSFGLAATASAQSQVGAGATSGSLASGDSTLDSGEFYDTYTYQARPGETVRIRMNSTEFDTYLIVRHNGNQSDNDDADGQGTNSEVVITSAAGGEITIGATSYAPGETGRYTLTISN